MQLELCNKLTNSLIFKIPPIEQKKTSVVQDYLHLQIMKSACFWSQTKAGNSVLAAPAHLIVFYKYAVPSLKLEELEENIAELHVSSRIFKITTDSCSLLIVVNKRRHIELR